jgi:ethylbenzene dioxygenase beta subunit
MTEAMLVRKSAAAQLSTAEEPISLQLHHDITQWMYREARLLDEERYRDWLGLVTHDIHYWLPFRENRFRKDRRADPAPADTASVYNESYDDLEDRVKRSETGLVWSEDPAPRVMRMVTNVEVERTDRPDELAVFTNVAIYRNRRQDEEVWYSAKRRDRLRSVEGAWKLSRRHIFVNHHVLMDENISMLF